MIHIEKGSRVLVVVAHPDDELLGCGSTLHRLIKYHGCIARAVILGEGLTSRSDKRDLTAWRNNLEIHKKNILDASKIIGYQSFGLNDFPDNRFDSVDLLDIIKVIEKEKKEFDPSLIFTHHGGDVNIDHQLTFQAVITASRPLQEENVKSILTFETPSGTEWQSPSDPRRFLPNLFISLEKEDIDAKIKAMECYEFEKRSFPHPRSPMALEIQAQRWGVAMGREYIEAFQLIRTII